MPPAEDIQQFLIGAWRLMMGKPDGIRLLDISADGFWNSFFAIAVAFPALVVIWVAIANDIGQDPDIIGGRFSIFLRLVLIDLCAWVLPLGGLALVARRVGIAGRFVHYVVATNWGAALTAWIMLPASLLNMLTPPDSELAAIVSLVFLVLALVLGWRLTNAALGRGPAIGSAVFAGMLVTTLVITFALQALLGLGTA